MKNNLSLENDSWFDKRFIFWLLLSVFFLYLAWSLVIPYAKAPDEQLRYDVVSFITNYKELPVLGDNRLFYSSGGQSYAAMPFLSYFLSACLCILTRLLNLPLPLTFVSRLVSVLSGVVAVYFVFLTAKKLFPSSAARYFIPVFLAFIPQFSFINCYTNQDAFMIMLSSIIIYLWVCGLETNWEFRVVIFLGLILGLMLLTYLNGYTLILASLFIVLISYKNKLSKRFFLKFALCIFIIFAVGGWYLIRNAYLYNGDFLGFNITNSIAEAKAAVGSRPSDLAGRIELYRNSHYLYEWFRMSFISFWATFENMTFSLPVVYFFYILFLCLISLVGLIKRAAQKAKGGLRLLFENKLYITFIFTFLVAFFLHAYYSFVYDYQPQGRYIFPALIPIVFLLAAGFKYIIPKRFINIFYYFIGISFIIINIATVIWIHSFEPDLHFQ